MYGAINYLKGEGIPHQLLFNNMTYNPAKAGREYIESIKTSHNSYEEATGLKVQLGEVKGGLNLYCIDIDCKGIPEEGKAAFDTLIRQFPQLRNTYIESTKSQGYHIFFYSDLKDTTSKIIFNYPFGIEVSPGSKLEIEVFLKGLVAIAPTKTREGYYTSLNDNSINFFRREETQKFFKFLKENSISHEIKEGSTSSRDPGEYQGEEVTGEALELLTSILELNGLNYDFKGNKIRVYGYNDGKNPDYRINPSNDNFYLWSVKDQNAKKPTLREYIEQHKEYIPSPLEKIEILKRDKIIKVKKYLSESPEVKKIIQEDVNSLIIAPCGSGKTYTVLTELFKNKDPFIFMVPNRSVKEQLEKEVQKRLEDGSYKYPKNNLIAVTGETGGLRSLIKNGFKQIICCYESLKYSDLEDLEDFTLVTDEVHSLLGDLHYRNNLKVVRNLDRFKRKLYLTATPTTLIKTFSKVVEVQNEYKPPVEITVIKPPGERWTKGAYYYTKDILERVSAGDPILHITSKRKWAEIATGEEALYSDYKDLTENKRYKSIVEKGVLPGGYTLSTNLFNAGVSLYNEGNVILIIDFQGFNINKANILQLINRPRKAKNISVFIIDRGSNREAATLKEVRAWGEKIIKKLNEGNTTIDEILVLNEAFVHSILYSPEDGFYLDEKFLEATMQIINGSKRNSGDLAQEIAREQGYIFKGVLTSKEIEEDFPKVETTTIKKDLRQVFVEGGKITAIGESYFKARFTKHKRTYEYQQEQDPERGAELTSFLTSRNHRNTIQKLYNQMGSDTDIEPVLKKYFKLYNEYDVLNIKDRQELYDSLVTLGEDNRRLGKTRKLISKHLEGFNPNHKMTDNQKVREILSYIDIKVIFVKKERVHKLAEK